MWWTKRKECIELCKALELNSVEELEKMVNQVQSEFSTRYYSAHPGSRRKKAAPRVLGACIIYLKENSKKVNKIIKKHHNDVATMVYSLGLVVGNQLIQSGTVNSMTAVYTLLMYLAKVGLDKFLADYEYSSDDTSDEGKGDTK